MTRRFEKAYNALTRAFFDGTLAKNTCMACACGNIIFDAIGKPVTRKDFEDEQRYLNNNKTDAPIPYKISRAISLWADKRRLRFLDCDGEREYEAKNEFAGKINEAGYTTDEFAIIETAFEKNTRIDAIAYMQTTEEAILEDQYNGLCAVVDVLMKLDNESLGGEMLKQKFREHPKLAI